MKIKEMTLNRTNLTSSSERANLFGFSPSRVVRMLITMRADSEDEEDEDEDEKESRPRRAQAQPPLGTPASNQDPSECKQS
jgi:hypothetical protein